MISTALRVTTKKIIDIAARYFVKFANSNRITRYFYAQIISETMNQKMEVNHQGIVLTFSTPNELCKYRAITFAIKEPETLEWIDKIPDNSVLWDIGANVGLYSCYSAKRQNCQVYAFEPSVFNLELLAKNIFMNHLTDKITIVPLPLNESLGFNTLNMTNTEWGGALSTFGMTYGHDGNELKKVFDVPTIGISMLDAVRRLNIKTPDYIKMDVDGIEHIILKGGMEILKNVRSVLVEVNDQFIPQAQEVNQYLTNAGLYLKEKKHAEYFDNQTGSGKHTFNQIWERKCLLM